MQPKNIIHYFVRLRLGGMVPRQLYDILEFYNFSEEGIYPIYQVPNYNDKIIKAIEDIDLYVFSISQYYLNKTVFYVIAKNKQSNEYNLINFNKDQLRTKLLNNDGERDIKKISNIAKEIRQSLCQYGNRYLHKLLCQSLLSHIHNIKENERINKIDQIRQMYNK